MNTVATLIRSTTEDLKSIRNNDEQFNMFEADATELAIKCGITEQYAIKRAKKVKHFHDERPDDYNENCPRQKFKTNTFYVALDTFIQTLTERFEDFFNIAHKFVCLETEFLTISESNNECLMELAAFYKADVNSSLLIKEYKSFCSVNEQLKKDGIKLKTDEVMPYPISNKLCSAFPNLFITYKIGTISANAERSFNRLKNIKTYNRSTMTQQRLNDIAILNIEKDCVNNLDMSIILDKFKSVKTRRLGL